MNQIITNHGWGLDQYIWSSWKNEFLENNWIWQDNDRGYFFQENICSKWNEGDSQDDIKMLICHSLGLHLINRDLFFQSSHIVLINSFSLFLPQNHERNIVIRKLNRMEKKFNDTDIRNMLDEFIYRSFLPNLINSDYKKKFKINLKNINKSLLAEDFKLLYKEEKSYFPFKKDCKFLIIKSKLDYILSNESHNDLLNFLKQNQIQNLKLILLEDQGHLLTNINLFKMISKWINEQ